MESKSKNVVPFGKYKGQPVEAMAQDQGYIDWLIGQSWFKERYGNFYTLIVNNFQEPSETPEHNALQVLFLDPNFCYAFMDVVYPGYEAKFKSVCEDEQNATNRYDELYRRLLKEKMSLLEEELALPLGDRTYCYRKDVNGVEIKSELLTITKALENKILSNPVEIIKRTNKDKFEHKVDVVLDVYMYCQGHFSILTTKVPGAFSQQSVSLNERICGNIRDEYFMKPCNSSEKLTCRIEIKPQVSDNYPAVLRQMRSSRAEVLFLESYTGIGATEEQFVQVFKSAGMMVIFKHQVSVG